MDTHPTSSPARPDLDASISARLDALERRAGVVSLQDEPRAAAELICLGMAREVGTVNDQLASALWDYSRARPFAVGELTASVEELGGEFALVVSSAGAGPIGFTVPGLRKLVNPRYSVPSPSGEGFERVVFFPVSVFKILRREDAEVVFIPSWARDMTFHPSRDPDERYGEGYKRRDYWATFPASVRQFCELLARHRLPLLSSHDLVYHIAGFEAAFWPQLEAVARSLGRCLDAYFARLRQPCVETLILPFMAGFLADALAQPLLMRREGPQIGVLIDTLMSYLDTHGETLARAGATERQEFPSQYPEFMRLMSSGESPGEIRARAWKLLDEIAARPD